MYESDENVFIAVADDETVTAPTILVFVPAVLDWASLNNILYILTAVFGSLPVARSLTSLPLISAVNVIKALLPVYTSLYVAIKAVVPLWTTEHSIFCNSVFDVLFALI